MQTLSCSTAPRLSFYESHSAQTQILGAGYRENASPLRDYADEEVTHILRKQKVSVV